ncbi:MAG TPA: glycosyltransferase [Gemmatimonadaceae bacterium]|nr:glycosyltransferase [Gemmatimonadaceae bacterium]
MATRNSRDTLHSTLAAIRASQLPRDQYELIVVDDSSTDGSPSVAARYADTVVKLTGRSVGPAYARNRGAEQAAGGVVAFVGADVIVQPDTLPCMLSLLKGNPALVAVSATSDEHIAAPNFVSQFWNLLVAFGEQRYPGRCANFGSACSAVRRSAFIAAGMYDEWRFAIGDIEGMDLGRRLLSQGDGVELDCAIKVPRLRRWRASSLLREVWFRCRALARSLGYTRMRAIAAGDVVFTLTRTLTPAMALVAVLMLAAGFLPTSHVFGKLLLAVGIMVAANYPVFRFYAAQKGIGFALLSAPLHIVVQTVAGAGLCAGWIMRDVVGDVSPDATTQAYSEVGVEAWPPVPRRV